MSKRNRPGNNNKVDSTDDDFFSDDGAKTDDSSVRQRIAKYHKEFRTISNNYKHQFRTIQEKENSKKVVDSTDNDAKQDEANSSPSNSSPSNSSSLSSSSLLPNTLSISLPTSNNLPSLFGEAIPQGIFERWVELQQQGINILATYKINENAVEEFQHHMHSTAMEGMRKSVAPYVGESQLSYLQIQPFEFGGSSTSITPEQKIGQFSSLFHKIDVEGGELISIEDFEESGTLDFNDITETQYT